MRATTCSMLERLRPLPPRLRIAHLAALLRWERAARAASFLSLPLKGLAGREGRSVAEARVEGVSASPGHPHPGSLSLADPPRKGEGSKDGRAG